MAPLSTEARELAERSLAELPIHDLVAMGIVVTGIQNVGEKRMLQLLTRNPEIDQREMMGILGETATVETTPLAAQPEMQAVFDEVMTYLQACVRGMPQKLSSSAEDLFPKLLRCKRS